MSRQFIKTTEKDSVYNNLELKSTREILSDINQEDKTVAYIVEKNISKIEILVDNVYEKLKNGGRLFYIGSGTSGRLGILDASECPPTFGIDDGLVIDEKVSATLPFLSMIILWKFHFGIADLP